MMKYDLFKEVITERIMEYMPPVFSDYEPCIESLIKVNRKRDALMLVPAGETGSGAYPVVYLDEMYELFESDEDMDKVLTFISEAFISNIGRLSKEETKIDFADKKEWVIATLIGTEMNEELLEKVPHKEMLNMAIVFRVIVRRTDDGFDFVLVNNSIMKEMGLTENELYDLAVENTKLLFPPVVHKADDGFILISNMHFIYGATSMIFEETLKEVCEKIEDSRYYIIPSSIHECFAVRTKDSDLERLVEMLANGNGTVTEQKEVLSNSIYCYDIDEGAICQAACYKQVRNTSMA